MHLRRLLLCLLILVIPAVSCRDDQIDINDETLLKSVSVEEAEVVLAPGGKAEFHFRIKDPLFHFSGLNDLVLSPVTTSNLFRLVNVRQDEVVGRYVADVQDIGLMKYSVIVRLGVRQSPGSEALVMSSEFIISRRDPSEPPTPAETGTGLPTVRINTAGGAAITSKTVWTDATMLIDGVEYKCSVRGRGNSTWSWPKKPYAIKLEKRASVLGMPEQKRWVLLANFLDRTLMRNIVAMKVASLTSLAWTPSCKSVDLVLNGRNLGNYLLIEQVRVDENRVNIDEKEGFMLELDFHNDNDNQWVDYHGNCWQRSDGIPFAIKYPEADDIAPIRVQLIKNYVSEVAATIYGPDYADPVKGYAKYLDVLSFIDYWIVFEVMGNHELNNPGSVFMHKDKAGKLTAGPCWDFDWGVLSYKTSPGARTGLVNRYAIWYSRLMSDPSFRSAVKVRFLQLLPELEKIPDFMEETEKMLELSAEQNFKLWNPAQDASLNGGEIINGDENLSFHEACVRLREIYQEHLEVIQKCL